MCNQSQKMLSKLPDNNIFLVNQKNAKAMSFVAIFQSALLRVLPSSQIS